MSLVFEFEHVTAGYNRTPVLRDMHFEVAEGEMVALLGPNGSIENIKLDLNVPPRDYWKREKRTGAVPAFWRPADKQFSFQGRLRTTRTNL